MFYWCRAVRLEFDGWTDWGVRGNKWVDDHKYEWEKFEVYSAYTVAELGELLPMSIHSERLRLMRANNGRWVCTYGFLPISPIEFNTEAEARAKMLIYLKENNLI